VELDSLHFGIGIEEEELQKTISPKSKSSKKSFDMSAFSKTKKSESKKLIENNPKSPVQSSIHSIRSRKKATKEVKENELDKEKILVYMQYFD